MDNLKILNRQSALNNALELAKANLTSTTEWVEPEKVLELIKVIYNALNSEG